MTMERIMAYSRSPVAFCFESLPVRRRCLEIRPLTSSAILEVLPVVSPEKSKRVNSQSRTKALNRRLFTSIQPEKTTLAERPFETISAKKSRHANFLPSTCHDDRELPSWYQERRLALTSKARSPESIDCEIAIRAANLLSKQEHD